MNTRKTVAGKTYIEFLFSIPTLFTIIKNRCSIYVAALVAEGKIKDPDRFLISDDEISFFYASGESAMFNAFNTLSQLSREITNILPTTVLDTSEGTITIRVGYKSTIDSSVINSWEIAIRDVITSYVLKDWYQQFGFQSDDGYVSKYSVLFQISKSRYMADVNWLDPSDIETARINLETALYEWFDGYITEVTDENVSAVLTQEMIESAYTPPALTPEDIESALGFTPYNDTNPDNFISEVTANDVSAVLTQEIVEGVYTPPAIDSEDVITALGYTPYDAANPDGYITG